MSNMSRLHQALCEIIASQNAPTLESVRKAIAESEYSACTFEDETLQLLIAETVATEKGLEQVESMII